MVERSDDDDQHITIICTIFSAAERACQARILSAIEIKSTCTNWSRLHGFHELPQITAQPAMSKHYKNQRKRNTRVKTT